MKTTGHPKRYYVYIYIDPRNLEWFYCGKGKGSRKEAHLFSKGSSEKAKRIGEIREEGLEPIVRVVAQGLTEEQAFLVEKSLIWVLQGRLLNVSSGHFKKMFRPHNKIHRDLAGFDFIRQIYFFNVGEGKHSKWEDNAKYGYLRAGQGPLYRNAISGLCEGDVVVAYLSGVGYVGVGVVLSKAKPAREFRVNGKLLVDYPNMPPSIRDNFEDNDYCEWMVPIRWERKVDRSVRNWKRNAGLYAPQLVRASLANQPETIRFVEQRFKIDLFKLADT